MPILPPFTVSIPSSEMAVRDALKQVLAALGPLELGTEEAGTVELVLAEVLNNVVEHAYPDPDTAGPISIACAHRIDGLHLQIVDQGEAMPDGTTPLGQPVSLDVDFEDLPEGGFGWFLIRDLAKDVLYERVGSKNQLSMRLAVALQPGETRH
ncbi:ATP-binding protein [Roseobacter sinensis]|uniref:ATP-binding protein n=1 Tax=Roseobacter sinensis TaxID=2931391 RepID=A0ABT3BAJ4_9RHOB|nr:ATP-binding protein [Roseobacter sp. WL0113]MCV3270224.1 ATP-binding protein [Roseobacter sp. WL0113]